MSRRSSRRSTKRRFKNEMNVVPYIDVMLVLLVIFMVTAPLITPGLINLPTVGKAANVPVTPVEVQLEQNGTISVRLRKPGVDFEETTEAMVANKIKSMMTDENTPVVISADGQVAYKDVVKLMDSLRASGIARLGLMVNKEKGENPSTKRSN
ncbi:biopolymer transporter ExbD [Taylorella equigenitalis]|uniref:Tol biopolymer transport system, TolR protein n=3 Tax=Taylorella equigenitalis TaxID=29575 RepID=A0A654KHK3_TAYEM|nr:biopolymer transporter ExbD [Taylorella equigenitalis]ADU91914.1 Tol biopolymer transport system, TolR protein [Taylorella equigenitalis MCE9]AFN35477.1 putative TolR-like translocation protein [Taylorella equigenitalis ATCC 35865]ASY30131.1 protein TolR [Taylorella equigenitalis]ASY37437.1 protein TolR [Taylorella equigenitalis]ASY38906.1 protein TolR [Taylorella equigenitalis]